MPLEPRPERPGFDPGYQIPEDAPAAPAWADIVARLAGSRNYWICSTRANGAPHATPVWGLWTDGALWFSSGRGAVKARNLLRDPRVSVHLESGDDVVIFEGRVEAYSHTEAPAETVAAYWAKYGLEAPEPGSMDEVWFRLAPARAFTWDERDFQQSAARWRFE